MPIVSALTRISPSPGRGVGTSTYSSADGPPGRRSRIAFIGFGPGSALSHNRISQNADAAVGLDLHNVAWFHPQRRLAREADPFRRAGCNNIPGDERRPIRAIGNQGRDVEDQIVDAGMLHLLAVEPRHQVQASRIRDLVCGDDPRSKAAGRVEILTGGNRMLELNIADRAVVEAGVAKNVAKRV